MIDSSKSLNASCFGNARMVKDENITMRINQMKRNFNKSVIIMIKILKIGPNILVALKETNSLIQIATTLAASS